MINLISELLFLQSFHLTIFRVFFHNALNSTRNSHKAVRQTMLTVATAMGNQWDWLTNPIKTQRIVVSPPAVALGIKHFEMFVNSTF